MQFCLKEWEYSRIVWHFRVALTPEISFVFRERAGRYKGQKLKSGLYKQPKSITKRLPHIAGFYVHKSLSFIKNSLVRLNYFILSNETICQGWETTELFSFPLPLNSLESTSVKLFTWLNSPDIFLSPIFLPHSHVQLLFFSFSKSVSD